MYYKRNARDRDRHDESGRINIGSKRVEGKSKTPHTHTAAEVIEWLIFLSLEQNKFCETGNKSILKA